MQLIDGRPVYSATDLVGFLACSHRLALERAALVGLVEKPIRNDPAIELMAKRGLEHEQRYLEELRAIGAARRRDRAGRLVADRHGERRCDAGARPRRETPAMRGGADVIYQATFFDGRWRGHADFLLRGRDGPSDLGAWSLRGRGHEARPPRQGGRRSSRSARTSSSSTRDPGRRAGAAVRRPRRQRAARRTVLRVEDYMAYYRRVKAEFEARGRLPGDDRVLPAGRHLPRARGALRRLPLERRTAGRSAARTTTCRSSPGSTSRQRRALKTRGVATPSRARGPAAADAAAARGRERRGARAGPRAGAHPGRGRGRRARSSGSCCDRARRATACSSPERGLLVLPEPSAERPVLRHRGRPVRARRRRGVPVRRPRARPRDDPAPTRRQPTFHEIWSRDDAGEVTRAAEKAAFERLDRPAHRPARTRDPATPRLPLRARTSGPRSGGSPSATATREDEVDRLLRGGVLVDLFRVVRQGIRASVESYSIKRLEPLYGLEREVDSKDAGSSIVAFETWLELAARRERRGRRGDPARDRGLQPRRRR